jgi:hypothetical protein
MISYWIRVDLNPVSRILTKRENKNTEIYAQG